MAWQCEFVSLTTQKANLVPLVRFTNTVTGESFTEDFAANDITLDSVKLRCAQRLLLLDQRDLSAATFEGFATGVFDPRL